MGLFNHHGVHTAHLWPTIAFALLSWVILLAGLSSVQDACRASQTQFSNTATGFVRANNVCSSQFRFPWWVLWLTFAVFLAVALSALFGHLSRGRTALCSFLAFTAVLLVLQTDTFLGRHEVSDSSRETCTFVGFLLSTIACLALIISVGSVHAVDGEGIAPTRGTAVTTSKV